MVFVGAFLFFDCIVDFKSFIVLITNYLINFGVKFPLKFLWFSLQFLWFLLPFFVVLTTFFVVFTTLFVVFLWFAFFELLKVLLDNLVRFFNPLRGRNPTPDSAML